MYIVYFVNSFLLCLLLLLFIEANMKSVFADNFSFALLAHHLVQNCDLRKLYFYNKPNNVVTNGSNSIVKVGIVGAGLSGLYAALLLQDLDIEYDVLEASNRVGGRFHTNYFGETPNDYNYVDLGALRFPKVEQYQRLIGDKHWSLIGYLNSKLSPKDKIRLIPFKNTNPNNIFYFNGRMALRSEFENSSDLFGFTKRADGVTVDKYSSKNIEYWTRIAFQLIDEKLNCSFIDGLDYLLSNDYLTFRAFLMDPSNEELAYPSDVVDWMETVTVGTGRLSGSFMDVYLGNQFDFNEFVSIDGGSSILIKSLISLLQSKPKLNQKVTAIKMIDSTDRMILLDTTHGRNEYSHVILTPTFTALRNIEFNCDLHPKKRTAMRTLNYELGLKVGFEFKSRFWENSKLMNGKPIFGGVSMTDLPLRHIVYPSYGINCTRCRGSLLVSYTWSRDAKNFLAFPGKVIMEIVLSNLAKIHGPIVYEQFTGNYVIMDWTLNPFTQGAFSTFDPGNFMSYYAYLIHPEVNGRLHFAGDTLSIYHGWSISALTSAFRAVNDLLIVEGLEHKIEELHAKWGTIEEPDFSYFLI